MLVGSPAIGKRAKRVPPRPEPQVGMATEKAATRALMSSMLVPRRCSWRPSAA